MIHSHAESKRVLAVDPTTKGFGFAVFEGPEALIDWGVKHTKEDRLFLARVAELFEGYQPDLLVVERIRISGCRRRERARRLIRGLLVMARASHIRVRQVSRQSVERIFAAGEPATKRQIAVALTSRFSELAPHLPPERKPWMSEDERMAIFDATAFGWVSYEPLRRERHALALLGESTPTPHA